MSCATSKPMNWIKLGPLKCSTIYHPLDKFIYQLSNAHRWDSNAANHHVACGYEFAENIFLAAIFLYQTISDTVPFPQVVQLDDNNLHFGHIKNASTCHVEFFCFHPSPSQVTFFRLSWRSTSLFFASSSMLIWLVSIVTRPFFSGSLSFYEDFLKGEWNKVPQDRI